MMNCFELLKKKYYSAGPTAPKILLVKLIILGLFIQPPLQHAVFFFVG